MKERIARAGLVVVAAVPISAPAAEAAKPHEFHNCAAVNEVYPHGIAKNFKVFKMAMD